LDMCRLHGFSLFYIIVLSLLNSGVSQTPTRPAQNPFSLDQICTANSNYDQNCLTKVLADIGTSPRTLVIAQIFSLSSKITIPSNLKLQIEQGGGFHLSDSGSLVISGPLEAGLYPIFFGAIRNVYFFGGAVADRIYPQWFGATGNAKVSGFTAKAGDSSITLNGQNLFLPGDAVTLFGAGPSGSALKTTVTRSAGMTLTLSTAPSTTVSANSPIFNEDDSNALNAWTNSVRAGAALGPFYDVRANLGSSRLYLPKGFYSVCSESVLVYSSTVMEGEQASTNTGGSLIQCNPAISVLRISANNFDPDGTLLNYGNGNSYFDHVSIRGVFDRGDLQAPAVQYLNAGNLHSDNRWDHPFFEILNGFAIAVGYRTALVGKYPVGSRTITLADTSTFCTKGFADALHQSCSSIVIAGAGPNGSDLHTNIIDGIPVRPVPPHPGGESATVVIDTPISNFNGVADTTVYPERDVVGALYIEHAELDVGHGLFEVRGRATGDVAIEHAEVFYATRGAVNADSFQPFALRFTDSLCYGCGAAQSARASESHSIYWIDRSNSRTNDIIINNVRFECANTTPNATCLTATKGIFLVGGIYIDGARTVDFTHNQLYNADSNSSTKSALFTNIINLNISDNIFDYDRLLTNWDSSVALRADRVSAAHIVNNTFNNRTNEPLPTIIDSHLLQGHAVIQGNLFLGSISQQQIESGNSEAR
jgi:hypothetical protein